MINVQWIEKLPFVHLVFSFSSISISIKNLSISICWPSSVFGIEFFYQVAHTFCRQCVRYSIHFYSRYFWILPANYFLGDGTTAQILAMLANLPEKDAPESRRGFDGAQPVDRYPFIFYDLLKAGYVTSYIEDSPIDASFHYRLMGFDKPPTTKYTRAFWMKAFKPLITR